MGPPYKTADACVRVNQHVAADLCVGRCEVYFMRSKYWSPAVWLAILCLIGAAALFRGTEARRT